MSSAHHVRPATDADYATWVRLFAELGIDDPVLPFAEWRERRAAHTLVLECDGAPAAYALFEPFGRDAHVGELVVDPAHRRRGLGRALMTAVAARLRAAGCERWQLNVKIDNAPARALYESLGMRVLFPSTALRLPWTCVDNLPAPPRALDVRAVAPEQCDALERAFALPSESLARALSRPRHVVLHARDTPQPDAPARGVASFAVDFPGAKPFRASDPAVARALLEALRPHARPEHTWVNVVAEDDAALADALERAGARVILRIYRMEGALP